MCIRFWHTTFTFKNLLVLSLINTSNNKQQQQQQQTTFRSNLQSVDNDYCVMAECDEINTVLEAVDSFITE
jgi:hypothetical protein